MADYQIQRMYTLLKPNKPNISISQEVCTCMHACMLPFIFLLIHSCPNECRVLLVSRVRTKDARKGVLLEPPQQFVVDAVGGNDRLQK